MPTIESEWIDTANQFQNLWQFNNCVGAMDGKHIIINKPPGTGSLYYNYKGTFSVVLFAIVNANYEFLYVHTGVNGNVSDGGILKHTEFYKMLTSEALNLPAPSFLPDTTTLAPYVFVSDSAFALEKNVMKPFPQKNLNKERRIFNYRLSRARRIVENVFGILSARFRIFQKPILINVENIDWVVLATCVLHNFLRKSSKNYISNNCVDAEDIINDTFQDGAWRQQNNMLQLTQNSQNRLTDDGKNVRNIFLNYFNNEGSVPFQDKMINVLGARIN